MTESYRFRISVSELAEFCCRRGDVGLGLQRSPTAQEGQQGQRTLQAARPAHYRKEIAVSDEWQHSLFVCQLSGRIDGVQEDDITTLEEIKTTYCDRTSLPEQQQAVHWAQLQLYGALYAAAHDSNQLHLRLTYLKLDDTDEFSFDATLDRAELDRFYQHCRQTFEFWLQQQCEHWQRRNTWLQGITFPFTGYRQGQRALSVQAYRDLRDGQRSLYQAATGLGKTSGVLFPALKVLGEDRTRQLWYLTAKNSGQRSVQQALDLLGHAAEQPLRVLQLSARERVCFCDSQPIDCTLQRGFYDRWQTIRTDIQACSHWSPEWLRNKASEYALCPHQLALECLPWADLVIADYNYVFDPTVRLADYLDSHAKQIALLVDEAHNLPDRARDMFSATLQRHAVQQAIPLITDKALQRRLQRFARHWFNPETLPAVSPEPPAKLIQDATTLNEQWLEWFGQQQWLVYPQDLFECLMQWVRFAQRLQRWQAEDRLLNQQEKQSATLDIFCTDPAPQLDALTRRFHAVLYFSGSLQPLDFFARAISQQPFDQTLDLPSPFAPQQQLTLIVPINTRYDARERSIPLLAALLHTVWQTAPGRYLVSFPSYHYLQALQQHLQLHHPDLPLLSQQDSADTTSFVTRLAAQPCFALVIAGGSYAEGLDLPDNLLDGVIVIGTCMPPPSLSRELIQQQFDAAGLNGFDFAFRYPGLNRVIQSAGRLIRNNTDRGIVILADDRFTRSDYRHRFPTHWQPRTVRRPEDLRAPLLAFRDADL